jgi:hypothetical protein
MGYLAQSRCISLRCSGLPFFVFSQSFQPSVWRAFVTLKFSVASARFWIWRPESLLRGASIFSSAGFSSCCFSIPVLPLPFSFPCESSRARHQQVASSLFTFACRARFWASPGRTLPGLVFPVSSGRRLAVSIGDRARLPESIRCSIGFSPAEFLLTKWSVQASILSLSATAEFPVQALLLPFRLVLSSIRFRFSFVVCVHCCRNSSQ